MINNISYYYNVVPKKLIKQNDDYYFECDTNYVLKKYDDNKIEMVYRYIQKLNYLKLYCHQIVLNKKNSPITLIDNIPYVLIKYTSNKKMELNDVIFFNYPLDNLINCTDWKNLWIKKLNYFEYIVNQSEIKYPLLKESFSYFAGYTELAVSLLNNIEKDNARISIAHNRLDETIYTLYDPFNFIIDYKIRDICEYLKNKDNLFNYLDNVLKVYNKNEISLFFIRMLYPSKYFDLFEQIIEGKKEEKEIKKIINNADDYDLMIKKLYHKILPYSNLPLIDF